MSRTPTGKHPPLSGFLGHVRQWQLFNRRLKNIQRRDGFTVFHAKEFKHEEGEFSGWYQGDRERLVGDLTDLVRSTLTEELVVHLEHDRYMSEYRAKPWPKKWNPDSQYGVCFRACLGQLLEMMTVEGKRHRLHVVVEHGPKTGNAREIFFDAKKRLQADNIDLLGDFTEKEKHEPPELMVADFLAHSYAVKRRNDAASFAYYANAAPPPTKRDAGLSYLDFRPGALQKLKDDFEQDRINRAAQWLAARTAKRAAPTDPSAASEE